MTKKKCWKPFWVKILISKIWLRISFFPCPQPLKKKRFFPLNNATQLNLFPHANDRKFKFVNKSFACLEQECSQQTNDWYWQICDLLQLYFDIKLFQTLPISPERTMQNKKQQRRVAAGWYQAKWACQASPVLASCLLSQLLTQSPVSSTLNGSSCCCSASMVDWSDWLLNPFPN